MGSARGLCSRWDSLHVCMSVSLRGKRCLRRHLSRKSGKKRGLLKRPPESSTRRVGKSRSIEKCREVSTVLVPRVYELKWLNPRSVCPTWLFRYVCTLYCTRFLVYCTRVVVYSASGKRYVQVCAEMYGTVESRFHNQPFGRAL